MKNKKPILRHQRMLGRTAGILHRKDREKAEDQITEIVGWQLAYKTDLRFEVEIQHEESRRRISHVTWLCTVLLILIAPGSLMRIYDAVQAHLIEKDNSRDFGFEPTFTVYADPNNDDCMCLKDLREEVMRALNGPIEGALQ